MLTRARFNHLILRYLILVMFATGLSINAFASTATDAEAAASAAAISADNNELNLKPPPGDLSIMFLGNIFGVVDGVLAGTGSQIAGTIFGVFNAAVLALGGILITYTVLVSTMNTAQDG